MGPEQVRAFRRDGFVCLADFATASELEEVRDTLDPLFSSFEMLPRRLTKDLGAASDPVTGGTRILEVIRPTRFARGLRRHPLYDRCRSVARVLLDGPAGYVFDHAIYKPPGLSAPTLWHQDDAYSLRPVPLQTVHFWIPLQPVDLASGCMWFVPGSHLRGRIAHHQVVSARGDEILTTGEDHRFEAVPCPLEAGGITVHHPLTLHYTGSNLSAGMRRAWILHFGRFGRLLTLHPRNVVSRLSSIRLPVRSLR